MNELIIRDDKGEIIAVCEFTDEQWNAIIQASMQMWFNKVIKDACDKALKTENTKEKTEANDNFNTANTQAIDDENIDPDTYGY